MGAGPSLVVPEQVDLAFFRLFCKEIRLVNIDSIDIDATFMKHCAPNSNTIPCASFRSLMKRTDVFLSHNWSDDENGRSNHDRVKLVSTELRKRGVITWLDDLYMTGDTVNKMIEGIDNSSVVLVFITKAYMAKVAGNNPSDNCRREFKYSIMRKTSDMLLPVIMEASMKNSRAWPPGQVLMELGDVLYCDFADDAELEKCVTDVLNEISFRTDFLWVRKGVVRSIEEVSLGGPASSSASSSSSSSEVNDKEDKLRMPILPLPDVRRGLDTLTCAETIILLTPINRAFADHVSQQGRNGNGLYLAMFDSLEDFQDLQLKGVSKVELKLILHHIMDYKKTGVDSALLMPAAAAVAAVISLEAVVDEATTNNNDNNTSSVLSSTTTSSSSSPQVIQFLSKLANGESTEGEGVILERLNTLANVQRGNKAINESLGNSSACELLVKALNRYSFTSIDNDNENEKDDAATATEMNFSSKIINKLLLVLSYLTRFGNTVDTSLHANIDRIAVSGGVALTISLLKRYYKQQEHVDIVKSVFYVVRNIATNTAVKMQYGKLDGLRLMTASLQLYKNNPEICLIVSWAIGNLASSNTDNEATFGSIGTCSELVNALATNLEEAAAVTEKVVFAIGHLSLSADNNIKFGDCGVCDALVKALTKHGSSPSCCESISIAITHLAINDNNERTLGQLGACQALHQALLQHIEVSPSVVELLCAAIQSLSFDLDNKTRFGSLGACELLLQVLAKYPDSAVVAERVNHAITNLSLNSSSNRSKFEANGACGLIVQALNCHIERPNACVRICKAIQSLSWDEEEGRIMLGTSGACDILIQVMLKHIDVASVVECASGAMRNLSVNDENEAKLGLLGACTILCQALAKHVESSAAVADSICGAIRNLSFSDENKVKLSSAGACEVLLRVVLLHLENAAVCEKAIKAIQTMSQNKDNRAKFQACNCSDVIMRARNYHKEKNPSVSEWADKAITCLSIDL